MLEEKKIEMSMKHWIMVFMDYIDESVINNYTIKANGKYII